jgi:hypothetical protein
MTTKRSKTYNSDLCQFPFADGRQCRMLRRKDHPTLCVYHAREENQLLESQQLGAELAATLTGNFLTATDVNHVLGKLFTALAQNRIPPRNAATLAYIGQLMLRSLPTVKDEFDFEYEYESWNRMLDRATPLSNSTPRPQPASAAAASSVGDNYSEADNDHDPNADSDTGYDPEDNANSDDAPDDDYDAGTPATQPSGHRSAPN